MAENKTDTAKEVGARTGRNPAIIAAAASVLLSWYQYYVRGNKEHGLFIGLWAPTLLAFSNAVRINEIVNDAETKTETLVKWLSPD